MKKILLVIFSLWFICKLGYCEISPVQIQLVVDKSEIFTTEFPTYTVIITNTGTAALQVIDTDYDTKQWVVDNPRTAIADPDHGPRLIADGEHNLNPGESYEEKPRIFFPERVSNQASWESSMPEPITLKIGFKVTPDAQPAWSNPITINFKRYADLMKGEKLEFEEINLDGYCFPIIFNQPLIQNQLVINDEQTYEQFLKIRRGIAGRVCDMDNELKDCRKMACSGLPEIWSDKQKQLQCADKICGTIASNSVESCMAEQACLQKNLPPIDFSQKTVLGQFTQGYCGTTGFKREVFKDDKAKTITYFVTAVNTIAACMGPGGQSLNLIAIPKIPAGYKVIFSYKFV